MSQNQAPKDKRTVSQKIEDLENAMINAYQMMNNMAADIQATKEGSNLIGMKTQAIVNLLDSGSAVNDSAVVAGVQALRAQRMADDIAGLVKQGVITPTDTVAERTLVVGRDLAKDGSGDVVNPRLQFVVANLEDADTKAKFLGAKVGDILVFSAEKNQFEIQEAYTIGRAAGEEAPAPAESSEQTSEAASS